MSKDYLPSTGSSAPHGRDWPDHEIAPLSLAEMFEIYARWWKLGALTFIGLLIPAVIVIFLILPLYEGHGSVWVDRQSQRNTMSALPGGGSGTTTFRNVDREEEISTRAEMFKAREIAERVVDDLDLTMEKLNRIRDARRYVQMVIDGTIDLVKGIYDGLKYGLGLGTPLTEEEKKELEYIRLVDEVIDRIEVVPVTESNILRVSFRTSDPVLARDLVNALLDEFLDFYGDLREDLAREFFDASAQRLRAELDEAEKELLQLQVRSSNFLVAEQKGALVGHYEQAKQRLRDLGVREVRLAAQVRSLKKHIKNAPNSVTIRQELNVQMIGAETELEALAEEKQRLNELLKEYAAELDTVASVNLEIRQIERRVKLLEEAYEMNVRNLEEARIGQAMSNASLSSVRIVSYAAYPLKTVRPRKLLYLLIAFGACLIIGLAMPFLAYMNDSTIGDEDDVRKYLGLDFVGTFPRYDKKLMGG